LRKSGFFKLVEIGEKVEVTVRSKKLADLLAQR